MYSIGIVGGSGYVGGHLLRILSAHPSVTEIKIYGHSTVGERWSNVFPELVGLLGDGVVESTAELGRHDAIFLALPKGESMRMMPQALDAADLIIDLGPDFRLSASQFEVTYGMVHACPDLLAEAAYGLADDPDNHLRDARILATPGCYPTAVLLSTLPLLRHFSVDSAHAVAYSGTSGAGKNSNLLMSEMDGNVLAYEVHSHRHEPEMLNATKLNQDAFSFTPHLLPAATGIYATTCVKLRDAVSREDVINVFRSCYESSPFVRLRQWPPHLRWVVGTNFCDIHVSVRGANVIVLAAIDNLIKGAAGQAVQNMNRRLGLPDTTGFLMEGLCHVAY
jgi:N-acetyl-gamma-glutamyl-phosphate reductase